MATHRQGHRDGFVDISDGLRHIKRPCCQCPVEHIDADRCSLRPCTVVTMTQPPDYSPFLAELRDSNAHSELREIWTGPDPKKYPGIKWDDDGQIQELCVDGLGLSALPASVEVLKALKKMWVSNNGLRNLPSSLGNLKAMESLMAGSNLLREVPSEIGELQLHVCAAAESCLPTRQPWRPTLAAIIPPSSLPHRL